MAYQFYNDQSFNRQSIYDFRVHPVANVPAMSTAGLADGQMFYDTLNGQKSFWGFDGQAGVLFKVPRLTANEAVSGAWNFTTNFTIASSTVIANLNSSLVAGRAPISNPANSPAGGEIPVYDTSGALRGGTPTAGNHLTTKDYVDALVGGIFPHDPAQAATTGTIADLSNATVTHDGVTLIAGQRLLVKDGASPDGIVAISAIYNGIYVVGTVTAGSAPLTRSTDADTSAEVKAGTYVLVEAGTVNGSTSWVQTTASPVLGTNNLVFTKFFQATAYTNGNGLGLTGQTFYVKINGGSTYVNKGVVYADSTTSLANSANLTFDATTLTLTGRGIFIKDSASTDYSTSQMEIRSGGAGKSPRIAFNVPSTVIGQMGADDNGLRTFNQDGSAFGAFATGNLRVNGYVKTVGTACQIYAGNDANTATTLAFDFPDLTNTDGTVQFFRNTSTTGARNLNIYRGNGSSSINTSLGAFGDSYLNLLAGNVGVGIAPSYKFHAEASVNGDIVAFIRNSHTSGFGVRIQNGRDTSGYAFAISNAAASLNTIQMFGDGSSSFAGAMTLGSTLVGTTANFAAATTQLKLSYDATFYATMTVSSAGVLTIAPVGGVMALTGNLTTSGTINGQTISSAANLTGSLTVAGAIASGTINGQTISSSANFTGTLNVVGATTMAGLTLSGALAGTTASFSGAVSASDFTFSGKTNNYLPKWSSNTLTGTSKVFDNGTNVGINNANPLAQLDITKSTTQLRLTYDATYFATFTVGNTGVMSIAADVVALSGILTVAGNTSILGQLAVGLDMAVTGDIFGDDASLSGILTVAKYIKLTSGALLGSPVIGALEFSNETNPQLYFTRKASTRRKIAQVYVATLANPTTTSQTVTHDLGTENPLVLLRNRSTGALSGAVFTISTVNTVLIEFGASFAIAFDAIVIG